MVDLGGDGTPEDAWLNWRELAGKPKLRMLTPPATAVVVAPHPDDEVLGVGGLLRAAGSKRHRHPRRGRHRRGGVASEIADPHAPGTGRAPHRESRQALSSSGWRAASCTGCGCPTAMCGRPSPTAAPSPRPSCACSPATPAEARPGASCPGPVTGIPTTRPPEPQRSPRPGRRRACSRTRCGCGTGRSPATRECPGGRRGACCCPMRCATPNRPPSGLRDAGQSALGRPGRRSDPAAERAGPLHPRRGVRLRAGLISAARATRWCRWKNSLNLSTRVVAPVSFGMPAAAPAARASDSMVRRNRR